MVKYKKVIIMSGKVGPTKWNANNGDLTYCHLADRCKTKKGERGARSNKQGEAEKHTYKEIHTNNCKDEGSVVGEKLKSRMVMKIWGDRASGATNKECPIAQDPSACAKKIVKRELQ